MTFTPTTSLSLHAHRAPLGAGPVDACARSCRRCGSGTSGSWTQWPVVCQNQITREFTVLSPAETEAEKPAPRGRLTTGPPRTQKKKDAIAQLAFLSTTMDDIDASINNELIDRTRNLDLD